ncbi:MAG: alpha/beta hydrolase family protein [Hyphomonadaceae bacterium]
MQRILFALLAAAFAFAAPAGAQQQGARAPLDWFLGYDQFRGATLSPDGNHLAVIRRDDVGDTLLVVNMQTRQPAAIQRARADQSLELSQVGFASNSRIVFRLIQRNRVVYNASASIRNRRVDDGFETNTRIYATNLDGSNTTQLYDPSALSQYIDAGIISDLPRDDDNILLIVPTQGGAELRKVNVNTAAWERVENGTLFTFNWIVDVNGTPVLRQDSVQNGRGYSWLRRGPGQRSWTEIARFSGAAAANSGPDFQPVGAATQPGQVFVLARREGQDTSGLYVYDAASGQYTETIQTNPQFDITDAELDTANNVLQAACWWAYRWTCEAKDPAFADRWTAINQALGDQVNIRLIDRSDDGNRWLIYTDGPQDLGTYYMYNHEARSLNAIISQRSGVNRALLPTQHVVNYTTSDGQQQWGYLWLPPGVTRDQARNLPTIVVPHGGPEGRDVWGYDPFALGFSSQGYAVFQPNFRGGGGFGRAFVVAGHGQWGQRMQEDVADAARHLISSGITDPNRICITGWSYGGYVAFTASFMNADIFKCSVAGAGVSDLRAMLRWVRSGERNDVQGGGGGGGSRSVSYQYWTDAIGDPNRDDASLDAVSAAQNADRVGMPLLIIHGDEDITVPIAQSQLMVAAMERAGKPTRLITLEDIDHYASPRNGEAWRTVLTESLAFFNQHIGPGVPPAGGAQP